MSARKNEEEIGMFLFEEEEKLELWAKIFTLDLLIRIFYNQLYPLSKWKIKAQVYYKGIRLQMTSTTRREEIQSYPKKGCLIKNAYVNAREDL